MIGLSLTLPAAAPEPDAFRMDHYRDAVPATLRGARVVHAADLTSLMGAQNPLLIDVLPSPTPPADSRPGLPRIPVPHRNIPGSYWLPEVGRGSLAPATEAWFKARLATLTGHDRKRLLVIYCLSQCWMSWNAAKRAVSYGYTSTAWFPDGADGWEKAGHVLAPATPETPPPS